MFGDLKHFTNIRRTSTRTLQSFPQTSRSKHHHIMWRLPFSDFIPINAHTLTFIFRSFLFLFCATFRLRFSLSGAADVSKLPTCLKCFTFTSFRRLSCRSTSNGVYRFAPGILYFEWSEHEMMQGERCVVNLNRDVCRCSQRVVHCPFAFSTHFCICVLFAVVCPAVFLHYVCHLHQAALTSLGC